MCLICDRIDQIHRGENPYFVREMQTGFVVIGDHQRFPGYCLFLCKRHETQLHRLEPAWRERFLAEMAQVGEAAHLAFGPDRINYECLGNGDAHLHWHLFPRRAGDAPQPGPVWWVPRQEMNAERFRPSPEELEGLKAALGRALDAVLRG